MNDERNAAIRARFDGRADAYDDNTMHRELAAAVAGFADLDDVRTVLDVATGTGLVARAFAARNPGLELVGVDLSPGMLAVARRELPSAVFFEGVAEELPVADASADLVTCVTALHIFADPLPVFEEFARVLAPEGVLVTATFAEVPAGHGHGDTGTPPEQRPPGAVGAPGYEPNHAAFATPEALAAAAAPAGFVVTRYEFRVIEDDRVLIAELAPVD
ncbi:class I SAM-dependent methyltransferase [Gryllotalpicola protaetiae]|uniref:Methyltransferase domain-containing protein n=1 Tax=Gryllotalpicola protaetiae TaxID=2419771 RepID=A0A387BS12_9MICO|nr:methyltransferase domain-containing protein [Gryllotalpicola protaetiae]AYG03840.1 methyltransferase domain-containing protein [Gryllotalpicola protaetiae]